MMTHKRHFCILPYQINTIRISQQINNKHKRWLENKKIHIVMSIRIVLVIPPKT